MKLNGAITAFIAAETVKNEAKSHWSTLTPSDDDYYTARDAFRTADDTVEARASELVTVIQELTSEDELADAVEALEPRQHTDLLNFLAERRMENLLVDNKPANFAALVTRWRNAGAYLTAAMRANDLRRQLSLPDFEETLDGDGPANVSEEAWHKVGDAYNAQTSTILDAHDADPDDVASTVTMSIVEKARRKYDQLTEKFVDSLRDLQSRGALAYELEEMDPDLRNVVHAAMRSGIVPELQPETKTKPEARPVAVLDRTETETDGEVDTDWQTKVDEFLRNRGGDN